MMILMTSAIKVCGEKQNIQAGSPEAIELLHVLVLMTLISSIESKNQILRLLKVILSLKRVTLLIFFTFSVISHHLIKKVKPNNHSRCAVVLYSIRCVQFTRR